MHIQLMIVLSQDKKLNQNKLKELKAKRKKLAVKLIEFEKDKNNSYFAYECKMSISKLDSLISLYELAVFLPSNAYDTFSQANIKSLLYYPDDIGQDIYLDAALNKLINRGIIKPDDLENVFLQIDDIRQNLYDGKYDFIIPNELIKSPTFMQMQPLIKGFIDYIYMPNSFGHKSPTNERKK